MCHVIRLIDDPRFGPNLAQLSITPTFMFRYQLRNNEDETDRNPPSSSLESGIEVSETHPSRIGLSWLEC